MLDVRIESFLAVYKKNSYTKAAEELCITQPAVTQHIQLLERYYGCKFFKYSNKQLGLTKAGELFYKYVSNAKVIEQTIKQKLLEINSANKTLKFAATLTIGEFTLPPILGDFMKTFEEYNIAMYVENTKTVIQMLQNGEIHFALVEGLFNKSDFETRLYKTARFILTVPVEHPLTRKNVVFFDDLKDETIIVREKGSGSREIFERRLYDKNYTLQGFKKIIEIGNVNVIKEMVKYGIGISFMYEDAVYEEIMRKELVEIKLEDFVIEREFNYIHLKNDIMQPELNIFYSFLKERV